MEQDRLVVGTIYVVAGGGDAALVRHVSKGCVEMDFHGVRSYVHPAAVMHEVDEDGLARRWYEGWVRGIICRRPGCWCEPYRRFQTDGGEIAMQPPTVMEIVRQHLRYAGYDGLYNADAECACKVDRLAPCDEMSETCRAGWEVPCDCGEHDWHISDRGVPRQEGPPAKGVPCVDGCVGHGCVKESER